MTKEHNYPLSTVHSKLPMGWEIKKLGEVSEILNGGTPKTNIAEYWDGDIHWITPADLGKLKKPTVDDTPRKITRLGLEKSSAKLFPENSIILSTRAPIGHLAINEVPMSTNQGCRGIVPSKKLDTWYLYYFLKKNVELLDSLGTGATFKELSTKALAGVEIPLPPLHEQQRIVSILDEAFAAIAKAKANAEQNLKNAKELFESYLQGVFENGNWETKKWGELCDFVRGPFGGSLKKNVFKESGYVVYEQKHAIHDHFNQLRYFIDEEKFNEMKRFEVFPGDIIMSCSGVTLGRVAVVPDGIPKGIINQALLKLTPKKNVNVHFIKHWLRSSIFQKIIFDFSGGAAIPNVPSAKILKDIKIPCPSLKEQKRIVMEIEIVLNESKRLEGIYQRKIDDLEELKKSILQKAFAGELRSPEGAEYANDGYRPSVKKKKSITSPEGA